MPVVFIFLCLGVLLTLPAVAQRYIKFTQQFTFEVRHEGQSRLLNIFADPKTSTWLLTRDDSFGGQPNDIDYWVLKPNGQIVLIGSDEHGKKQQLTLQNKALQLGTKTLAASPTGKRQTFGQNQYGWKTLTATEYQIIAGRYTEKIYALAMPFDCRALLAYNFCIEVENHLPAFAQTEYHRFLPTNFLVVQDKNLKLISVSPTEYFINL